MKYAEIMSEKYFNIPSKEHVKHRTHTGTDHHSLQNMAESLMLRLFSTTASLVQRLRTHK